MDIIYSCTFTGHRPQSFSFGYDEAHPKCIELVRTMALQIENLAEYHGVKHFYSGMALGVDMWAAELVLGLKQSRPDVTLTAVIPCETQANRWSDEHRRRYFDIQSKCDDVIMLNTHYTSTCMQQRNRYMVDHAEYLIAVYNGQKTGGTAYTANYAEQLNRKIITIEPESLKVTTPFDAEALKRRCKFWVWKK